MTVDGYQVGETLSEDRIARVFSATREADGMAVRLTVFNESSPDAVQAALAESENLATASSFHIVPYWGMGITDDGLPYLVSPAVDGTSLATVLSEQGGLKLNAVLRLAVQMARALKIGHDNGCQHFDIAAANVYLSDGSDVGKVQVDRFGGHHVAPLFSRTTKSEHFYGTPQYLAPEICGGKTTDLRADFYSFGILLYEAITAKPPFLSNSYKTTIKRHIYEKPLPLHLVKPGVTHVGPFEELVNRAINKDPAQRFQTAQELLDALEAFQSNYFPELVVPDDPGAQHTDAAATQPVEEAAPEPVEEAAPEPVEEAAPEPVEESTPEATETEAEERTSPLRKATLFFGGLTGSQAEEDDSATETAAEDDANADSQADEQESLDDDHEFAELEATKEVAAIDDSEPEASDTVETDADAAKDSGDDPASSDETGPLMELIQGGAEEDEIEAPAPATQRAEAMDDWFMDASSKITESEPFDMPAEKKDRKGIYIALVAILLVAAFATALQYLDKRKKGKQAAEEAVAAQNVSSSASAAAQETEDEQPSREEMAESFAKNKEPEAEKPVEAPKEPLPEAAAVAEVEKPAAPAVAEGSDPTKAGVPAPQADGALAENSGLVRIATGQEPAVADTAAAQAAEKATADRAGAEKAALEKAEADRIAAEKAVAEKAALEKAAAERAAAEKATLERAAAERAATAKVAADKAVADRAASKQASIARAEVAAAAAVKEAAIKAAAKKATAAKAAADKAAAAIAAAERAKKDAERAMANAEKAANSLKAANAKSVAANSALHGQRAAHKAEANRAAKKAAVDAAKKRAVEAAKKQAADAARKRATDTAKKRAANAAKNRATDTAKTRTAEKKARDKNQAEAAKKRAANKRKAETAKKKAATKRKADAAKRQAAKKKKEAATAKPAGDPKAKSGRMISLGHSAMKKKNYKLALLYYKRAKALNNTPLVSRFIGLARKKLSTGK